MTLLENALVAYARHFPLRRGKLRLVNALWRRAAGDAFKREAVLRHGGFRVPCDLNEMLQRQFYYFGTYFLEENILAAWEARAKCSRTVFDVGANAGIFSLAALAANPAVTVHAFEPTPEIAARLRTAAAMNDLSGLVVNEAAVGDRDGEAQLQRWRGVDDSNEGMNFITTGNDASNGGEAVRLVSLDGYCAAHGIDRIDMLKIDIQGNEPAAFAGAAGLLREKRIDTIFAELNWDATRSGGPASELVGILSAAGFLFASPEDAHRWREPGDWLHPHSDIIARVTR